MSIVSVITAVLAFSLIFSVKKRREVQLRGQVPYEMEPEYQEPAEKPEAPPVIEEGQPALPGKSAQEATAKRSAKLKGRDLIVHSEIMRPKFDDM